MSPLLDLQRSAGNAAVAQLLAHRTDREAAVVVQRGPLEDVAGNLQGSDPNLAETLVRAWTILNGLSTHDLLRTLDGLKQQGLLPHLLTSVASTAASAFGKDRLSFALGVVSNRRLPAPLPPYLVNSYSDLTDAQRFLGLNVRPRAENASAYVTVAESLGTQYMAAAMQGTTAAQAAVANGFDWTAWAAGLVGNTIWAATAFIPTGTAARLIFGASMFGVSVASAGALPKDATEFGTFATTNLNALAARFAEEKGPAGDRAFALATADGWDDNRTRLEIYRSLLQPQFITLAGDGTPSLNHSATVAAVERDMLLVGARTGLSPTSMAGIRSGQAHAPSDLAMLIERDVGNVGKIKYEYDVPQTTVSEGGVSGFFGARDATPPSQWSFSLRRATMMMRSEIVPELTRVLRELYGDGPVPVADLKAPKFLRIIEGGNMTSEADTPEVEVDASNSVTRVHAEGRYRDYLDDTGLNDLEYGRRIVAKAWTSSGGRPPAVRLQLIGQ